MTCYINLLKASYIAKIPVTCPLDRSDMPVEPSLLAMVETEMIMNDFFKHMHMTVNHLSNVRSRTQEPTAIIRRDGSFTPVHTTSSEPRRSVRVRRAGPIAPPSPDRAVLQIVHVEPPLSPTGVDNVRDSMDYLQAQQLPSVFPEFTLNDPNSMEYRERNFIERTNAYTPAVNLFPESPTGYGWPTNENIPPTFSPPGTPP